MADTASDALYDIRRKIRAAESSIRDRLEGMIKSPNTQKYLQESVVSLRSGRFVVPVKAEYRGEIPGVIHDVSSSGAMGWAVGSVYPPNCCSKKSIDGALPRSLRRFCSSVASRSCSL